MMFEQETWKTSNGIFASFLGFWTNEPWYNSI